MGGEELKWRQLINQLISSERPHFSPRSTVKTNNKGSNLTSIGISDVVSTSVYSEKTRMKKLMMMKMIIVIIIIIIISIMNKLQDPIQNCKNFMRGQVKK